MARIPYPDFEKLSDRSKEILGENPLNVMRMMVGAAPEVIEAISGLSKSFFHGSRLPADLREIAILRAGYIAGSDYETWQHEALAREIGISNPQIEAIKRGGAHPDVFSPAQQAVLDFAGEFVVDVRVSDGTLAEVRRHIEDDQLIDLMMVTGFYMMISRILETMGIERDEKPLDMSVIDALNEIHTNAG